MPTLQWQTNQASAATVAAHLRACDKLFVPPLTSRVRIDDYALKITALAQRFEAWADGELVGLVAAYFNASDDTNRLQRPAAFITSVSVLPHQQCQGIAAQLLTHCIEQAKSLRLAALELEVDPSNRAAARLYEKLGFVTAQTGHTLRLRLAL